MELDGWTIDAAFIYVLISERIPKINKIPAWKGQRARSRFRWDVFPHFSKSGKLFLDFRSRWTIPFRPDEARTKRK